EHHPAALSAPRRPAAVAPTALPIVAIAVLVLADQLALEPGAQQREEAVRSEIVQHPSTNPFAARRQYGRDRERRPVSTRWTRRAPLWKVSEHPLPLCSSSSLLESGLISLSDPGPDLQLRSADFPRPSAGRPRRGGAGKTHGVVIGDPT